MNIVIALASLTTAVILVYIAGSLLGYPFGQFLLPYVQRYMTDIRNINPHDQQTPSQSLSSNEYHRNPSEDKLVRHIGAILAYFFCFAALMIELSLEGQKDVNGEAKGWNLGRMSAVLTRACVEGLLVLVILRGIRYIGYLLLN